MPIGATPPNISEQWRVKVLALFTEPIDVQLHKNMVNCVQHSAKVLFWSHLLMSSMNVREMTTLASSETRRACSKRSIWAKSVKGGCSRGYYCLCIH